MRRTLRRSLLASAMVAAIAAAIVPAMQAHGAGGLSATFTSTGDWGTGHGGSVKITNDSASPVDWTLVFDLPAGTAITGSWDVTLVRSGDHYTATKPGWAGQLAPGSSFSWGYNGSGPYRGPVTCTLNGGSCSAGGPPPPPPPPPSSAPPSTGPPPSSPPPPPPPPPPGDRKVVGYFAEWGVYGRNYHVKNLHTSGSAAKMTHILYAFGNPTGGGCAMGDSYASTDKAYTAADSVDGVADTWDQPLRGTINQFKKLKRMYPHIKIIYSIGGWTWSAGFTQAAQNPQAFANACYNLVKDPRWADVFDGIDVDWEYPNACGLSCDSSGPNAFKNVIAALRSRFGSSALVTAAITADGTNGGKIDATDYAGAVGNLNWIMPMTYDYFGAWAAQGPTAPHSPLNSWSTIPIQGFYADAAIQKLRSKGIPPSKMLLGIGFYGRGWTGVSQAAPGGSASGPAQGLYEQGVQDYKLLKTQCPSNGTVAGTAYAFCGNNWWSYDTPATVRGKMTYAKNQGMGGAFFWELSGDTTDAELLTAIRSGLA
jgi:chitinase